MTLPQSLLKSNFITLRVFFRYLFRQFRDPETLGTRIPGTRSCNRQLN